MAIRTFTMLGKMYEDQKVHGWYASEKLDGCRGLWLPGFDSQYSNDPDIEPTGLWSRDGKVIHAPKWWLRHLPQIPLDGELYLDRQSFQQTMSIVRKKRPEVLEWQHIKFMAFDIPMMMPEGVMRYRDKEVVIPRIQLHPTIQDQLGFRFVYHLLCNKIEENDILKVVKQTTIKDSSQIKQLMEEIVNQGGEGLMLREPYSKWEQCRSKNLLKVKPFNFMEVEVVGYYYGDGKYYGMMGALEAIDAAGRIFKVSGFTDEERRVPSLGLPFSRSRNDDCVFRNGTKIQIKYRELSKGNIPKEARYERP